MFRIDVITHLAPGLRFYFITQRGLTHFYHISQTQQSGLLINSKYVEKKGGQNI